MNPYRIPIRENTLKDNLRLSGVIYDSMADGEGVRAALYFSGCDHRCPGCHNPETHDFYSGQIVTSEVILEIAEEINKRPYLSGITMTGGDPLYRPAQLAVLLQFILDHVDRPISVWLYTGFRWEDVFDLPVMSLVDVVVDGPFIWSCADKRLAYCGSTNQRIIDVKKSIESGEVALYEA